MCSTDHIRKYNVISHWKVQGRIFRHEYTSNRLNCIRNPPYDPRTGSGISHYRSPPSRMYCIDTPGVPENSDPCTCHCLAKAVYSLARIISANCHSVSVLSVIFCLYTCKQLPVYVYLYMIWWYSLLCPFDIPDPENFTSALFAVNLCETQLSAEDRSLFTLQNFCRYNRA